jgi:hypothetical protein
LGDGLWEGSFKLDAAYSGKQIIDLFQIQIIAGENYPNRIPALRETGGRVQAIASKYRVELADVHYNVGSNTACVCVKQDETARFPPGSKLPTFIEGLVVPYLYGLSFFDETGRWPWTEFSHGGLGLLEFYAQDSTTPTREDLVKVGKMIRADPNWRGYSKQLRRPSSGRKCLCGSGRPISECHYEVWQGINKLHAHMEQLGLKPRQII